MNNIFTYVETILERTEGINNLNFNHLTAKEKYDILCITAIMQDEIMNCFDYFNKGYTDYKNKKVILDNGIQIDYNKVSTAENKLLRARFLLVDIQKAILDIDDLMLEGRSAMDNLKAQAQSELN